MSQKAILFISHGSRAAQSREENIRMSQWLKESTGAAMVQYAFLEVDSPSIPEAIEGCRKQGAGEIIVLLNFLNSGRHVNRDIPEILAAAQKKYPELVFHVTPPLGAHPKIPELFLDLVRRAETGTA